jgi:DnaA protein/DnaA-like protein
MIKDRYFRWQCTRRTDRRFTLGQDANGYWSGLVTEAQEADFYHFWVTGDGSSGYKRDPYARELATDVVFPNCSCIIRSATAYPWHDSAFMTRDFTNMIVYQTHIGTYAMSKSGTAPTFLDVVGKIPYLVALEINSLQPLPVDEAESVDTLILDDVQFLAGRERTQEEFFHTFNSLHSERHQIVLTSDKIPRDIAGLEERLRNRFESGLIADIAPPDLETRVAIVQKKAAFENLQLPPEVTLYVAQNVSSNVRELEGCLTRVAALASISKSTITPEFARHALRDLIRTHEVRPDVEAIQKIVSDFFHIRLAELKSKKRTQHIAFCRQVAMYLCRKLTDSSFPAIGAAFGRDHSTVIHACNLIARRISNDSAFRFSIEKVERELEATHASAA